MNWKAVVFVAVGLAWHLPCTASDLRIQYDASQLPAESSPRWSQRTADKGRFEIAPEGLRIVHSPSSWGDVTQAAYWFEAARVGKMSVEASVRTLSADKRGAATLGFSDGVREEYATCFPDSILLHRANVRFPANFKDGFRRVRLERKGMRLRVSVDGKLLYDKEDAAKPKDAMWVFSPQVRFGCLSASASGESIWKDIVVDLKDVSQQSAGQPPFVAGAEHFVIYRQEGEFPQFPEARLGEDGALYVKAGRKTNDSHMATGGRPLLVRSDDAGRTWVPASISSWPPAMASKGDQGILVTAAANGWRKGTDPELRKALEAEGVEVREAPDKEHYMYAKGYNARISRDGGASWERREFDFPGVAILMNFHEDCTLLRLDGQTVLRAVYSRPIVRKGYYESYVLRSEDNGASWNPVRIYADPEQKLGFGETALARAANGDIVAMLRQEPMTVSTPLWVARSSDGGKTWSKPEETPMVGHPASLTPLRDGRLLCTYGFRDIPMGVHVGISEDNGKTWRPEDVRVLRADGYGTGADNGYPITQELPDGTLVTVCYLTGHDGVTFIAGSRWRWEDSPAGATTKAISTTPTTTTPPQL